MSAEIKKNSQTLHQKTEEFVRYRLAWWVLLVILVIAAVMRYGLLEVPLERDEGEYAYAGQLILQGIPPYQELYNMKLPGIYAAYAGVLAIFGQTHGGIHLGLLFINAATIILVFLLAKHLTGSLGGVTAAACFAVLSVSNSVQGVFANAEHFVILPAVGGLLLLVRALDDNRPWLIFGSGLLLGIGFLMKQHGAAFAAFGGVYVLACQLRKRPLDLICVALQCGVFAAGVAVPYIITCLILMQAGVFEKFWFWTVKYAMAYTSQVPADQAWAIFKDRTSGIGRSAPLIWILSGLGLTALVWDERSRAQAGFTGMFVLFSFLAICPGFYFRPHYFVLALPASALLAGIGASAVADRFSKIFPNTKKSSFFNLHSSIFILLVIICLTVSVFQHRRFLFRMTPVQASRFVYGYNPFPESLEIARFLRTFTKETDQIAIIGSEPQIYFYSGRRSASGYVYMYALMENHEFALRMQKEMIQEVESAQPEILIFVNIYTSWLGRADSHTVLTDWVRKYQAQYYELVGLADILKGETLYYWGPDVKNMPTSSSWIAVMKRKKSA